MDDLGPSYEISRDSSLETIKTATGSSGKTDQQPPLAPQAQPKAATGVPKTAGFPYNPRFPGSPPSYNPINRPPYQGPGRSTSGRGGPPSSGRGGSTQSRNGGSR